MTEKKTTAPRLKNLPDKNIAIRLKALREDRDLTLISVAEKLAPYVEINLSGNGGRSVISNLENQKQNLTIELAIAYSKVFNASLEYILCESDDMQPENKEVKETVGLSDKSIAALRELVAGDNAEAYRAILNTLCDTGFMIELLKACNDFLLLTITHQDSWYISDSRWSDEDMAPMAAMYLTNRLYNAIGKAIDPLTRVGYEHYEG